MPAGESGQHHHTRWRTPPPTTPLTRPAPPSVSIPPPSRKPPSEFAFFSQAEDGIRGYKVTGVQTCALPIWMLFEHPRRNRVGGRAHDDANLRARQAFHDAVHPGELEPAILGLPKTPGGFSHADHVEAGLLHQLDVFVQAILRHVFFVEGGAV